MTSNPEHPLRTTRKAAGLSLRQLADATGIDKAWLSRIENGHNELTERVAVRAAAACGVPTGDLVRWVPDLPASLRERIVAIPGLLSCLTLTPDLARKYGLPAVQMAV